jgi:hypothetical protein
MSDYTKKQRKAFVRLLKAAKGSLWDGTPGIYGKHTYICLSVREAQLDGVCLLKDSKALCDEIDRRMAPHITLRQWLKSQGIPTEELDFIPLQAHRLAWINLLIKEFSA